MKKKKNNLNVLTYGYLPKTYLPNWGRNLWQFFRNIKYAYQRVTRGFCDQDVWSLSDFYSELFYQSLNHLANTTIGCPAGGEFEDSDNITGFEKWQNCLKEMAEHFLNTQEYNEDVPINQELLRLFTEMESYIQDYKFVKLFDSSCSQLEEVYKDEDKYNKAREIWLAKEEEAYEFRNSEKDIAFSMMQKYFFNLWD